MAAPTPCSGGQFTYRSAQCGACHPGVLRSGELTAECSPCALCSAVLPPTGCRGLLRKQGRRLGPRAAVPTLFSPPPAPLRPGGAARQGCDLGPEGGGGRGVPGGEAEAVAVAHSVEAPRDSLTRARWRSLPGCEYF